MHIQEPFGAVGQAAWPLVAKYEKKTDQTHRFPQRILPTCSLVRREYREPASTPIVLTERQIFDHVQRETGSKVASGCANLRNDRHSRTQ